jgi:hypothetical protein
LFPIQIEGEREPKEGEKRWIEIKAKIKLNNNLNQGSYWKNFMTCLHGIREN